MTVAVCRHTVIYIVSTTSYHQWSMTTRFSYHIRDGRNELIAQAGSVFWLIGGPRYISRDFKVQQSQYLQPTNTERV